MQKNILYEQKTGQLSLRRRDLLVFWVKFCVWFFILQGIITPIYWLSGLFGRDIIMNLYGLKTTEAASFIGIIIPLFFFIKGIIAFGLWTEKKWAVTSAIIDAAVGLLICTFVMFYPTDNILIQKTVFIPIGLVGLYLIEMIRIRKKWAQRIEVKQYQYNRFYSK